ncbi:MAG: hypothetical protein DWQ10_10500 [Calditrichaeota bacterium]|nr:MAG: hypothetical protein DWQ10_10500 [Calditrichota bacterium]
MIPMQLAEGSFGPFKPAEVLLVEWSDAKKQESFGNSLSGLDLENSVTNMYWFTSFGTFLVDLT